MDSKYPRLLALNIAQIISPEERFRTRERKFFFFFLHPRIERVSAVIVVDKENISKLAKDFDTRALFPVFLSKQRTLLLWPSWLEKQTFQDFFRSNPPSTLSSFLSFYFSLTFLSPSMRFPFSSRESLIPSITFHDIFFFFKTFSLFFFNVE